MDSSVVEALAIQAGFTRQEQAASHDKLERFAGLVLALRDENQTVQLGRLQKFMRRFSLADIEELANSGKLEKFLPTFEILPEDESPIKFADLKPIDFRKKD